jgi:hypothetical protein
MSNEKEYFPLLQAVLITRIIRKVFFEFSVEFIIKLWEIISRTS